MKHLLEYTTFTRVLTILNFVFFPWGIDEHSAFFWLASMAAASVLWTIVPAAQVTGEKQRTQWFRDTREAAYTMVSFCKGLLSWQPPRVVL